jgi:hypothetical protein
VKYQIWSLVLLFCFLAGVFPARTWAEKGTIMVGVDEDQLFAGAWFSVAPRLDLMATLYDNSRLGWGFHYHHDDLAFELSRELNKIETAFSTSRGALRYSQNDSSGTKSGTMNWNYRDLGLTGYYATDDDSNSNGTLNARWDGTAWRTLLHGAYRHKKNDNQATDHKGERLYNYRLKDDWRTGYGAWSLELQDNMFSEGSHYVIGEGAELAWNSLQKHWLVAYGQFHETDSDLTEDRIQLQWQGQRERAFNERISVGFDTMATDYLYGNRESQQVGSLTGWWRYSFGPGSLKWNLKNIWRAGLTPFQFDYEDEHSFYTGTAFDWQGESCHSNFSIEYDLQDSEWRTAHGLLEAPLGGWRGSLTANYDLEADYDDSDLVYLLLLTSPQQNFTVDQTFNYKLGALDTDWEWQWNFISGDGFRMKFSYDCEDRELDNLLLEYQVAGGGKFTLTYDLDKPKVMLVYQWGQK